MEVSDEAFSVGKGSVGDHEWNRGFTGNPTAWQEKDFTKKSQKAFSTIVMSITSSQ